MSDNLTHLSAFCQVKFGTDNVENLRRLSGGASMESWMFSCADQDMILRRLPKDMKDIGENEKDAGFISLSLQADIIETCYNHGIAVPHILARLTPADNLGTGFIMNKVDGEALPQKLLKDPAYSKAIENLSIDAAKALAAIHNIALSNLPDDLPQLSAEQALGYQDKIYRRIGTSIPAFDLAIGWLKAHLPPAHQDCLVHGDFRLGNLLVNETGLTSVLDWELAHIGDPVRDIAYMCTPSWRFGNYKLEAGGFDSQENWLNTYEALSGTPIDRDRFRWWLMFNTLWWGVSCLLMGNAYRDGSLKTLERTIIGRRVSEVEIDLLLQFENLSGIKHAPLLWREPSLKPATDEMCYSEIAEALAGWNQESIMPASEGLDLYTSRMARNALGILQRRLAWGDQFQIQQTARLEAIGLDQNQLCQQLRQNAAQIPAQKLWDHLRLTTLERASIDQPRYAGFKIAKDRWT